MSECGVFFLVGPTAIGKSSIAHHIALQNDYDIVSADSMLIYSGMNVGTAKPSESELAEVKYYCVDVQTPDNPFTVHDYYHAAVEALIEIEGAGRTAIVVGGTGLYIKALIYGMSDTKPPDPTLRSALEALHAEQGLAALQERLKESSHRMYDELKDKENPRRLIRAIEMADQGLMTLPEEWRSKPRPRLTGLRLDPHNLKERIRHRVLAMYDSGLMEETAALLANGFEDFPTASQAIGYAEAVDHVKGKLSLKEAIEATVTRTNRLAKHQATWFRNQADVDWVDIEMNSQPDVSAEAVLASWETNGTTTIKLS